MDGAEEVAVGLVVAAGNAPILHERIEELLDQVTGPVQVLVILAGAVCGIASTRLLTRLTMRLD